MLGDGWNGDCRRDDPLTKGPQTGTFGIDPASIMGLGHWSLWHCLGRRESVAEISRLTQPNHSRPSASLMSIAYIETGRLGRLVA